MEAIGEFIPDPVARPGLSNAQGTPQALRRLLHAIPTDVHHGGRSPSDGGDVFTSVAASLEHLTAASPTAAGEVALLGFREAADFAGQVEELSRTVEYLQLVAAAAVDSSRHEASRQAALAATGTN